MQVIVHGFHSDMHLNVILQTTEAVNASCSLLILQTNFLWEYKLDWIFFFFLNSSCGMKYSETFPNRTAFQQLNLFRQVFGLFRLKYIQNCIQWLQKISGLERFYCFFGFFLFMTGLFSFHCSIFIGMINVWNKLIHSMVILTKEWCLNKLISSTFFSITLSTTDWMKCYRNLYEM